MLGTATPYPHDWLARQGTLSQPLLLLLLFPPLGLGQSCLSITHPRRSPDPPSRRVAVGGNPAAASIWQMDTDFEQTPGVHRAVGFDQNLNDFSWSHPTNYRGPRHEANDRRPEGGE